MHGHCAKGDVACLDECPQRGQCAEGDVVLQLYREDGQSLGEGEESLQRDLLQHSTARNHIPASKSMPDHVFRTLLWCERDGHRAVTHLFLVSCSRRPSLTNN